MKQEICYYQESLSIMEFVYIHCNNKNPYDANSLNSKS